MITSVLIAFVAQAAAQQPLHLTCLGEGTANKVRSTTVRSSGHGSGMVGGMPVSGSGHSSSTMQFRDQQDFADQVDVRLFTGDDRIRLPRTMLPILKGGEGGWFKLKNLQVDARAIKGKAAVNIINNPNVLIDRVTGTISISGKAGDYSGRCEAIQPDAAPKF